METTYSFARYEKKYLLTRTQRDALMACIGARLKQDAYPVYTICSLYYDTDDYRLVRASLERPIYKEKLRVRSYGVPDTGDAVFVELKKKYDGVVYKRRVTAPLPKVAPFLAGRLADGAFGLVRFRSAPGTAREIAAIFSAMALGLATGMGYLALAVLFFVIFAAVMLLLTAVKFGAGDDAERILKITIPENLDYDGLFTDLFERYLRTYTLEQVKTSNMGTLYELQYRVTFRQAEGTKAFLDELRCRNGNLNICCARAGRNELL